MIGVLIVVLTMLHILLCLFLILVVLLQPGRGGGMGGAFGGSSQTIFGSRGAGSFLGKLTAVSAALFMINSIALSKLSTGGGELPEAAEDPGISTLLTADTEIPTPKDAAAPPSPVAPEKAAPDAGATTEATTEAIVPEEPPAKEPPALEGTAAAQADGSATEPAVELSTITPIESVEIEAPSDREPPAAPPRQSSSAPTPSPPAGEGPSSGL